VTHAKEVDEIGEKGQKEKSCDILGPHIEGYQRNQNNNQTAKHYG